MRLFAIDLTDTETEYATRKRGALFLPITNDGIDKSLFRGLEEPKHSSHCRVSSATMLK